MKNKKILIKYLIIFLIIFSNITILGTSKNQEPPRWNKEWSFRQEINIPISTNDPYSIYQPIDISIEFPNLCWGKNTREHSIRVLCWDGEQWHEIESQIYDIEFRDPEHISKCGIVFLIPEIANGNERYYVYYDDQQKPEPDYPDHVKIEDSFYYYEPISGVAAEGDYFKITEHGYVVYGVGEKGKAINRWLSQVIVKQKPGTEEFGLLTSDNLASFCFSYHIGTEDEDEISSDQRLLSKDILVDGNLMVEFKIVSESYDKTIRTTNIYKYYYCPTENKRISVHVKHQVLENVKVKGVINVDGRYGAIISYKSTSEKIEKMRFGKILPFLHVYTKENKIREYKMLLNPEDKEREWIIPYTDDCDLGKNAWLSYDEGTSGKAHGIIFSSNKNIVESGTDERDGIQIKVAEKEYFRVMGSEIDYAAINWGRNSYEKGGSHDIDIPGDLCVEYDAEFYTSEQGGYPDVIKEAQYFQTLIKYRHKIVDEGSEGGNENIYTLTISPRFTGRILSHPALAEIIKYNLTTIYAEIYKNNEYISTSFAFKPWIGPPKIKFPKLSPGNYTIKIYRRLGENKISFIGFKKIQLKGDTEVDVYCTWPIKINIDIKDQYNNRINNVELILLKNESIIDKNITTNNNAFTFEAPFTLVEKYTLKAFYKGFEIYNDTIPIFNRNINVKLNLYDIKIKIEDTLGFPPGVDVRPILTSLQMAKKKELTPEKLWDGCYIFKDLPKAKYTLQLSYGGFYEEKNINIPSEEQINIEFNAKYSLKTSLYDTSGNPLDKKGKTIDILRNRETIYKSISLDKEIFLPPGNYTIYAYSDGELIGLKNIVLTNDKKTKIVTTIDSMIQKVVPVLIFIFIGEIVVLILFKKISLNSFLKLLAMSFILLSLFQPWWYLDASSSNIAAEKHSEMYILKQTIIEKYEYDDLVYYELANIPDIFTDFLVFLTMTVLLGFILMGLSFLPNILLKRRYSKILILASVFFLILVTVAYHIGMSKITGLSLGSLQSSGALDVVLPNYETVQMNATWGLGIGFYLCIFAALIGLTAGISDLLVTKFYKKRKTRS